MCNHRREQKEVNETAIKKAGKDSNNSNEEVRNGVHR